MKIKHHIIRKFQEAPVWKWLVVILIVIAMPLFFMSGNIMQTQQAADVDDQQPSSSPATQVED